MDTFTRTLRNVQVILLALAGGLIFLTVVILFMVAQLKPAGFAGGQGPQWNGLSLFTVLFLGISLLNMLVAVVLPPLILNNQIAQWAKTAEPITAKFDSWETNDNVWLDRVPASTLSGLLQRFQTSRILAAALNEAAGMMCAIAYLLEAHAISLIVIGMAIALMLWHVPTRTSLSQWLFTQIEKLQKDTA